MLQLVSEVEELAGVLAASSSGGLCGRLRQPGERLCVLANDIVTLSRRAYAHMPLAVQSELARD